MTTPTLSIILPNYNHGHFLPLAIQSVLNQSFSDFELLIVDDGSTDNSVDLINDFMKTDSRIKLLRHAQNCGIAAGFATALKVARGGYIQQFSATDCMLEGYLEKSMTQLLEFPDIGVCCADVGLFDQTPSSFVSYPILPGAKRVYVFPPEKIQKIFKFGRFSIPGLTSIVKRHSCLHYGGYQPSLHFLCDTFLNHRIALFEGAIYIPETLALFREPGYSKNQYQKSFIRKEAFENLLNILTDEKNRELLSRMKKAALLGILGKQCPLEILKRPKLWSIYIGLGERFFYTHLRHLLGKKNVCKKLLEKHSFSKSSQS